MSQTSCLQNNKSIKRNSQKKDYDEDNYKKEKPKDKKKDFSKQRQQKRGELM
jgi:hypothetical protein